MKILLIQPKAKAAFRSPPLGLQLIATILKSHNYKNIYDIDTDKGDDPYSFNYSGENVLIGMSVTFMTIFEAFNLAKIIKSKNNKAKIIFGGPQPTLMPKESIENKNVDIVAIGEGHYTILEIANCIKHDKSLNEVDGIWYKKINGEIIKNKPRDFIKDLDTLPFPDKTFFNDAKYQKYQKFVLERIFIPSAWFIMTAYSCPYNCKMCQPALRKIAGSWRQRSVGNVITEIKLLKKKYNAKRITFYDNDMGIDKKWLKEFCKEAKKINDISMTCCGRANLLDYEMLKLMKEAGFDSLSFGAESGNDRVLKDIMNKKTTIHNIIEFANNCYKLNIRANAFWMTGNPGETIEEMKDTIKLASELPLFYSHFHIANPNPGTQYYIDAVEGGYLNLKSWVDIDERIPRIIKSNVTVNDVIKLDNYLIKTMVNKGWSYTYRGHTLAFFNTRIFAKKMPFHVFGNEINMFLHDFKIYHFKNIILGIKTFFEANKDTRRF